MDGHESRGAWRTLLAGAGVLAAFAGWPLPAGASPPVVPPTPPHMLGETAPATATRVPCSADAQFRAVVQDGQPPTAPAYVAPADGVITGWMGQTSATGDAGRLQLLVLRGTDAIREVIGASPVVDVGGITGMQTVSQPVRIAVMAGDYVAIAGSGERAACTFATETISDTIRENETPQANPFTSRQTLSFAAPVASRRANVSARLEPDADRDGWGDHSQDRCPSDPAVHGNPCPAPPPPDPVDYGVWILATRSSLDLGDQVTFMVTGTRSKGQFNPWMPQPAMTISLPPGLPRVVADDRCQGVQTLRCPVGVTVQVTTLAYSAGLQTIVAEIKNGHDADPSNDRATIDVTVRDPAPAPKPPPTPARCKVPRLRGLSLPQAKAVLKRARCRLGRVKRAGKARGRLVVIAQTPRAGIFRPPGARVGVRLGRHR